MSLPNTQASLRDDLSTLGLEPGTTVMVHSSLGQVGWTVGGPVSVIRALLEALGEAGTLAMPAETPQLSDPSIWNDPRVKPEWHDVIRAHLPLFDPATTPTTMGAIPEAFRTFPGTLRSLHPLVSVCANGRHAEEITRDHALEFCEGRGTPFEKLYNLDGYTLLLGVGFTRCTSLHYAESLVPKRRTERNRYPLLRDGTRTWVEVTDMSTDGGQHFPVVGELFMETGAVRKGRVGEAEALLFSTRALVDLAETYFSRVL
ncbi:aminoglycoside N(3)-acetyltransferase [Pelagibius sp. Alg239-R121]|uniref:aminoglycoside N(3)-acetyltransferase n=1 Tax=Pelagibius sp. Alg239-R121 TaxID=2993448 RepID=UPI0024A64D7E|nr:AAC(3) family N-acetyltransferase [Pelagibius sp. Alg239-R121]